MNRRAGVLIAALATSLLATVTARAQIGGSGSIQGTVLDGSGAAVPGATVTATNVATGVTTTRATTQAGVYVAVAARSGRVPRRGDARRLPAVQAGERRGRRARRGRPQRHAGGRRLAPGSHGLGRTAAPEHCRRPAGPDHPQRRLHGAAARDEHRRAARSDGVHVPDAGRAVGRPLGQRDGRPGFHQRHLRRRRADHERCRAGRRPQPVVRHLGRGGGSVPGRDQRHRRDVQRPGRVELRHQIGNESISGQRRSSSSATRRSTPRRSSPASNRTTTSTSTG